MESGEEKAFFKFLTGQKAESELTKSLEEKVSFAKKNMKWRKQYMTWQQTIDEEKDISFEEGQAAKAIEAAENLIKMNILTSEQIAQALRISIEEVEKIAKDVI